MARYRDALKKDLSAEVLDIAQRQSDGAKRNHDRFRNLRNQFRAAA